MPDQVKYDLPPQRAPRTGHCWLTGLLVLVIGGVVGYAVRPLMQCGGAGGAAPTPVGEAALLSHTELTALAEQLERNQLYAEAARTWEQAARQAPPQGAERAELLFRIGKNFCLANAPEQGLTYLFAAEAADEEGRWKSSINSLVLEGLSSLGREDVRAHQASQRVALDAKGDDKTKPVAQIGGEPITDLDLQTFARRLVTQQMAMQRQYMSDEAFDKAVKAGLDRFKDAAGRKQLVQIYLSQELLYREALAAKLPDNEAVREEMKDARRQILIEAFLDDYLGRRLQVGETDLENAYEARKAEYVEPEAFKVEAIVVGSDEAKTQASEALEAGTAFEQVRDEFSTLKPGGETPGPFNRWITRDGRVPLVADSRAALAHIVALQEGEVGGKWLAGTGGQWVRLRLVEHRAARQLALAECRERVEGDLRAAKQEELLRQLQESLQRKYDVVINESELEPKGAAPAPEAGSDAGSDTEAEHS